MGTETRITLEAKALGGRHGLIISLAVKVIQVSLGCLLLLWLITYISSNNLAAIIRQMIVYWFVASIACWIIVGVLSSERLAYITRHNLGVIIPLKKMFTINQLGMLLSDFTPGRSGYFGIMYYLQKEWKIGYDRSFGMLIGIQLVDFLFKALLSTVAVALLLQASSINASLRSGLIVGLVVFIAIVFTCFLLIWYNKSVYFDRILCKLPLGDKLARYIQKMNDGVSNIKSSWAHICLLSLAGSAAISLQWWLIGKSINIDIPLVYYFAIPSLISAIAFVPIGIAGLGIQELGVTAILIALGNSVELAVTFSILLRLSNIIGDLTGIIKVLK